MADKLSAPQEIRKWYQAHIPVFRDLWDARDRLHAFLDGRRYANDSGPQVRDKRRIQIRGPEIQDTHRYVMAKATEKARSVEARPLDHLGDDQSAETAASLIEYVLGRPYTQFDERLEEAILDCREARIGMLWMDFNEDRGAYGEFEFTWQDPNAVMWDECYHPHEPGCERLLRRYRMDLDLARAKYKAPWLQADKLQIQGGSQWDHQTQTSFFERGTYLPQAVDDNKVTLWECWYKNDPTKKQVEVAYDELAPGDRYMACQGDPAMGTPPCGYRTPTQDTLAAEGKPQELPAKLPNECPDCGGNLQRIDAKQVTEEQAAYRKGKRLVVFAPYCANPKGDTPLYDGEWPIPDARSFPLFLVTAYTKGGRPAGPCDTDLMWDQQLAADELRTTAVRQVLAHRTYWKMSEVGIHDHKRRRFEFRDDQRNVMFINNSLAAKFGPPVIEPVKSTGVDPNFMVAFGPINTALTQFTGKTDLGPIDTTSTKPSGVAIAQLNQIGNVPVEHFKRRLHRALGMFYGVVWDYIRACFTSARLARLRLDDVDLVVGLQGDDLPDFDFIISDTPEYTGLEKARGDAAQSIVGIVTNPVTAPYLQPIAKLQGFPPSVVREFEKVQQQQPPPGMPPGMPAGGGPGGPGGPLPGPTDPRMQAQLQALMGGPAAMAA